MQNEMNNATHTPTHNMYGTHNILLDFDIDCIESEEVGAAYEMSLHVSTQNTHSHTHTHHAILYKCI